MATEAEFNELKESVAVLTKKVNTLSALVEKQLIKTVEPLPDEVEAFLEYEEDKKNNTVTFIPLEALKRP